MFMFFLVSAGSFLFCVGVTFMIARHLSSSRTAPYKPLFRIGVYFVVIGIIMMTLFVLMLPWN